jgi:hypothetical protein
METDVNKNLFSLVVASFALVAINVLVWVGVQNGQLAPFDSTRLWGVFVVLDIISLLWAFSLLGLQPMVLAFSYTAGGYLAYQGVQGVEGVGIAEATTAGATYGAAGAMVVGNITTKVRLTFFRKEQIPFVFIFTALLMVDGFMNSRISGAGHHAVLSTLVYPFAVAGVLVGLVWMLLVRMEGMPKRAPKKSIVETEIHEEGNQQIKDKPEASDASQLMIQVPDEAAIAEELETAAALLEISESEPMHESREDTSESSVLLKDTAPVDKPEEDQFFPLEIDKDDEFMELPEPSSGLVDLAALVADESVTPELVIANYPIPEPPPSFVESEPVITSRSEFESFPEVKPVSVELENKVTAEKLAKPSVSKSVKETSSNDWLSGHLDLLSKINNEN